MGEDVVAERGSGWSRRRFLGATGALAGAAWMRVDRVRAAEQDPACGTPPDVPAGIDVYKQRYENWSGEIVIDEIWTATATSPTDVVALANWARTSGHTLRPRGFMHNWAPLTVTPEQSCASPVLVVDARQLAHVEMEPGDPYAVRVGAGAAVEDLLRFLHGKRRSLSSVPAVGQITVGGALAIGGHGAAVPAAGETPAPTEGFGTLSNLVVQLDAVVFDAATGAYRVRTFTRRDPELAALLVHLGRAFVTEVVLRVGPARNLRCVSTFDVTADEVFAAPEDAGPDSFGALLERAGRVESIWFPFTERPWTKVWSVAPRKPRRSRRTTGPYNYPFSDQLPDEADLIADQAISGPGPYESASDGLPAPLDDLVDQVLAGNGAATPALGLASYALARGGTAALLAGDLWGPAFHTQLYIRWSTLRLAEFGFVVLLPRRDAQGAIAKVVEHYREQVEAYRARGLYPINGPMELRASLLDHPDVVGVPGASSPTLSALRPRPDHPDWDTGIWFNLLTFPGTPGCYEFLSDLEHWIRTAFDGTHAAVRSEWSKGWGYSPRGPWTDTELIQRTISGAFRGPGAGDADWEAASRTFEALDPARIYTNPFLDKLFPRRG